MGCTNSSTSASPRGVKSSTASANLTTTTSGATTTTTQVDRAEIRIEVRPDLAHPTHRDRLLEDEEGSEYGNAPDRKMSNDSVFSERLHDRKLTSVQYAGLEDLESTDDSISQNMSQLYTPGVGQQLEQKEHDAFPNPLAPPQSGNEQPSHPQQQSPRHQQQHQRPPQGVTTVTTPQQQQQQSPHGNLAYYYIQQPQQQQPQQLNDGITPMVMMAFTGPVTTAGVVDVVRPDALLTPIQAMCFHHQPATTTAASSSSTSEELDYLRRRVDDWQTDVGDTGPPSPVIPPSIRSNSVTSCSLPFNDSGATDDW